MQTRAPSPTPSGREVELIRGVEVLIGKLSDPGLDLPLTMIDRLERALHLGHRSNLLRLSSVAERALTKLDPES